MSSLKDIIAMDMFITIPPGGDVRMREWPLMDSIWPTAIIIVCYVLFIYFGEQSMKKRQAFELRNFMFAYNFVQVVLCTYITYEAAYVWITERYSLLCQSVDFSQSPIAMRTRNVCWWFYIMKIVDLIDTIIFILRKKDNQITFLHVYHHITMTFCGWAGALYVPGGQTLFIVIINSFIHMIMYSYYGLSACGPQIQKYLWWKRYITQAQMMQFFAVIIHSVINLQKPCNYPKVFDIAYLIYAVTIWMLFANFYLQSYIIKEKRKQKESRSN